MPKIPTAADLAAHLAADEDGWASAAGARRRDFPAAPGAGHAAARDLRREPLAQLLVRVAIPGANGPTGHR
jgi:hypothetical protein